MSTGHKLDQNQNPTTQVNEKLIDAIKSFQFVQDPFKTPTPSEESLKRERLRSHVNDTDTDGVYCKAEPGSEEWKKYQASRLKSIKDLKKEKQKALQKQLKEEKQKAKLNKASKKQKDEKLQNPTAIKSSSLKKHPRSASSASRESIKWKEPIDDSHLPSPKVSAQSLEPTLSATKTHKRSKSPKAPRSSTELREKVPVRRPSTGTIHDLRGGKPRPSSARGKTENTPTEGKTEKTLPKAKTESISPKGKAESIPTKGKLPSYPRIVAAEASLTSKSIVKPKARPLTPLAPASSTLPKRKSGGRKFTSTKIPKEPIFPSIELCQAYPGTPQWDTYWDYFNGEMKNYHKKVERYQRLTKRTNKDLGNFMDKFTQEAVANNIFRLNVGLKPGINKPPLLRQPITESMTLVGGYTIRRVKMSKDLKEAANVLLTTFDYKGFRLEIEHSKLSMDLSSFAVKKDSEYNLIVISLFDGSGRGAAGASEQIHIGVPIELSVRDVIVGAPADNGGKIVVTTSD